MTATLLKRGNLDMHTRRKPCQHEVRYQGHVPTSQRMQMTASKPTPDSRRDT